MDKRQEANKRVKERIGRALFSLIREKNYSDITVSDIIAKSGVARASYYRNYYSKDEIIIEETENVKGDYQKRLTKAGYRHDSYEGILLAFRYFKAYRRHILCVYKAGMGSIYQKLLDEYLEIAEGDMLVTDVKRYMLYYYSGAVYNVFMKWLESGMKESPEEIAELVYTLIKKTR